MTTQSLEKLASRLVTDGKGILAADESVTTLTRRFEALRIPSTAERRRQYREMLFTTPGVSAFISGVIMYDETIRQTGADGTPFAQALERHGILPGIKVDVGARPLAGAPEELVTEGLDGLRDRLTEYERMGARFAKWRAVLTIGEGRPSRACVKANAHALARYAVLCQEVDLVPIVEPEVLMDGSHTLERCEAVTGAVLDTVFDELREQRVGLEAMLLKPNMVIAGKAGSRPSSVDEVATATLRCLRRHVPAAVPGIVFLSGGQSDRLATTHLNAINRLSGASPWRLTFSYGRALQDAALQAWKGDEGNVKLGQQAFYEWARRNGAACLGNFTEDTALAA